MIALYLAAFLLFAIGLAHSVLGERYLLVRLFRRDDLPKLGGSADFTKRVLRFAWHITTIAWWGIAAILCEIASANFSVQNTVLAIGLTFILSGITALIAARGKHYSWIFFLLVGVLCLWFAATKT
ncbi:MAG: hypothetical protein V4463_11020 [Pseudomonadota bacterium]